MTIRNTNTRMKRISRLPLAALLLFVCGFGLVGLVYGFMNEATSLALEAATPYVEQGFEVREDNWSGEVTPGKELLVKHQLFRGNEYWFWAGTSWPGSTIEVAIFDKKGMAVGLESFSKDGKAGVRVLPSKTGMYFIRLKVLLKKAKEMKAVKEPVAKAKEKLAEPEKQEILIIREDNAPPESLDWGLVYGYR